MEKVPNELQYTETHEWCRIEEDGSVVVGITFHAQAELGELVFVDLPDIGIMVHAFDEICVVESVKAASDVYTPLSGKIIAINEDLEESPGFVNSDPYGDGWLFKIEPGDPEEFNELMDASKYQEFLESDEE
jgi:glycine cleavage system H protein